MLNFVKKIKDQGGEHVLFIGATILYSGIHFIYSIYVKAFVAPLEYGMYSTCLLLQTYMAYLQLGTLNAFNRDYPQLIGAEKKEEAKRYRDTVFSFILSIYTICTIAVIIIMFFIGQKKEQDYRIIYGFVLAAILTAITIFENYGNYRCRIDYGFKYPSSVTVLEVLSIPGGWGLVARRG